MAKWAMREHGKGEIDRVGAALVAWWGAPENEPFDIHDSYAVVDNWRSSHAMPLLVFRDSLAKRAKKIDPKVLIAQRLKRFSSIMNKLNREPNMKLSQMQDLGGCRAILRDMDAVNALLNVYERANERLADDVSLKFTNYIENPKSDGYRGIHIIGRYKAKISKNVPWNYQRIELQLRTQLQHAFSTAVETVATFTKSPLKTGGGPAEWRRFFTLVGSSFAEHERTPLVPDTPADRGVRLLELRSLTEALQVRTRLTAWASALRLLPKRGFANARWVVLKLDVSMETLQATGFKDYRTAAGALAAIEQTKSISKIDAVLVNVKSINLLRKAYPNYYADTAAFVRALDAALDVRTRK